MNLLLPQSRRNDLDALRAIAMLLGVALHAALAFSGGPWIVQDSVTHPVFHVLISAIHGFRMPLFFLMSGFFTAMLWRRRGLRVVIKNRFHRVVLPMLLGMITVVPLMHGFSLEEAKSVQQAISATSSNLWKASAHGELEQVKELLEQGKPLNETDPVLGMTPLSHATLHGHEDVVRLLLARGADARGRNRDGGTALHLAAFLGRAKISEHLLRAGATPDLKNVRGETAIDVTLLDEALTRMITQMMHVHLNHTALTTGRQQVRQLFGADRSAAAKSQPLLKLWFFCTRVPLFCHLWFLWFLCWMAGGFVFWTWLAKRTGWQPGEKRWITSNWRWLWLVPLTLMPAWIMSRGMPHFGPETSSSLVPPLPLLGYYAVFFSLGVLYFDAEDSQGELGRHWWLSLPIALLLVFPAGLALTYRDASPSLLAVFLQVLYAWLMCFGLMGLFRAFLSKGRPWLRYLSDASYWMYLAHLPLVVAAQQQFKAINMSAGLKFAVITTGSIAVLLLSYEFLVRPTWLGRLLNGTSAAQKQ